MLIELRPALVPYQDYHMLSLTFAGRAPPAAAVAVDLDAGFEGLALGAAAATSSSLFQGPLLCQTRRLGLCSVHSYTPGWRDRFLFTIHKGWRDLSVLSISSTIHKG